MKPKIYCSPLSKKHDTGHGHPESPARITMLEELFQENGYDVIQSSAADLEHIMLAHSTDYIFDLQDKTPEQGLIAIDGDTILSPNSYDAALYAAGAVINAVNNIDEDKKYFCAVRPPGHHAEPNAAMGFCLFNNIFIGARYAQESLGLKKIVIVDFDVHHGNGTETMCRAHNKAHPDKPIFYVSSHGYPLFPMTGDPAENDATTLNIRLPENCGSQTFRDIYKTQVFPALEKFAPGLLMLSSGFDAHKDDPLAQINLETADYGWLSAELVKIANKHAKGRLISVLEGGYQLEALKNSVEAHLTALEN